MSDASIGVIDQTAAGQTNTKQVATIALPVMQPDGSVVNTNFQVVVMADERGHLAPLYSPSRELSDIRDLLVEIRDLLERMQ